MLPVLLYRKGIKMFEERDYIMRLVHELIRTLIRLIFGIDIDQYRENKVPAEIKERYRKLRKMTEEGQINEAENLLSDWIDPGDRQQFLLALLFYEELNQKEDAFLAEYGYSRQEIRDGVVSAAGLYGYGSMAETFAE